MQRIRLQGHSIRQRSSRSTDDSRNGLSLLEVIISIAIFLAALTVIMYTQKVGQEAETAAHLKSEAVIRCEAVMGEILCGAQKAESSADNHFDDDEEGKWEWAAEISDSGTTDLLKVTVLVEHRPDSGSDNPNAAFALVRYMRDPQLFLDAALEGSEE